MNERIKELFKRAGGKTSIHNLMSNPIQQREYHELWNENIQKFAELIVKECANIAFDKYAATNGAESGESAILKHFGVEE